MKPTLVEWITYAMGWALSGTRIAFLCIIAYLLLTLDSAALENVIQNIVITVLQVMWVF